MSVPCDQVDVWLGRFRDGELKGRAHRDADRHVAECDACRDRIKGLDLLGDVIREGFGAPDTDGALATALERRIRLAVEEVEVPRPALVASAWQASAAAALLALAVAGGLFLLRASEAPSGAPIALRDSGEPPTLSAALSSDVASAWAPVVVRVLPSSDSSVSARVMETGDADFQMVWIGELEGPP